jgi:hypothetical protein
MAIDVDTDTLREHAKSVDFLADDLQRCSSATGTTLGGDDFGKIVGWLAETFTGQRAAHHETLGALQQEFAAAAEALRSVARQYDQDDESVSFTMKDAY